MYYLYFTRFAFCISSDLAFCISSDLRSAYHQIPLQDGDKKYTAFESDGKLYNFVCMPFRITNGVAGFQRVIDSIIETEKLEGTFAYVDNITVCGVSQAEHDYNLKSLGIW